jgi:hypothetical protein
MPRLVGSAGAGARERAALAGPKPVHAMACAATASELAAITVGLVMSPL